MSAYKVAKVAGPRNHRLYQGPSNGAVTFYDAGFLASAAAVGLSQVSKMLRQLSWQILAHHSLTPFSFGPRTTYCTSCLGLCKCWEWMLDPFVSSSRMAFDKDPYVILPCIYYTLFFRVMSSKVMICRILFTPMTARYTCPFTVTGEPGYSKSKRVSLTPVVGWEPIGSNSITKKLSFWCRTPLIAPSGS